MKRIRIVSIFVAVGALIGAIYYYAVSNNPLPAKQRYADIFNEPVSVSCSNLVLTAWSANQLTVQDKIKIELNELFHSRGITAPLSQTAIDDMVREADEKLQLIFISNGSSFYETCEKFYLSVFEICEESTSNQNDFLKCWVDNSGSEKQKDIYKLLTDDLTLPDVDEEPIEPEASF